MTCLVNGQVLDVRTGRFEQKHIRIDSGRISELSGHLPKGAGDPMIDLAGGYVLPGFFDCHVHICSNTSNADSTRGWGDALPGTIAIYAAQAARRLLMAGITTARDVGGWDYHEIAVREAIRKGWIEGPRLHCAGRILTMTSSTTAYYRGMYEEADGPDAVRKAARKQLARGAQFLKVLAPGAVASTKNTKARWRRNIRPTKLLLLSVWQQTTSLTSPLMPTLRTGSATRSSAAVVVSSTPSWAMKACTGSWRNMAPTSSRPCA